MRIAILMSSVVLSIGIARAVPSAEHEWHEDLTGTWRVEVTTYNCKSGQQNPSFMSLLTFAEGGTLTGTTSNPVFQPGQRSSEMGYWRHRGADDFVSVTEAFIEFSTPAHGPVPPLTRGVQRIEQAIDVTSRHEFTSEATLTFFDESGTVLSTACAKATAHRLQ